MNIMEGGQGHNKKSATTCERLSQGTYRYYSRTVHDQMISLSFMAHPQEMYGHSVTESAIALCPELKLQRKVPANKARTHQCKRDRQVHDHENAVLDYSQANSE